MYILYVYIQLYAYLASPLQCQKGARQQLCCKASQGNTDTGEFVDPAQRSYGEYNGPGMHTLGTGIPALATPASTFFIYAAGGGDSAGGGSTD